MNVSFEFDLVARCLKCGAKREVPEAAERTLTLEGAAEADGTPFVFADTDEMCRCGGRRVSIGLTAK